MRQADVKNLHDKYVNERKRQKSRNLKLVSWSLFSFILTGGLAYLLFFSDLFRIRGISIAGLDENEAGAVMEQIQSVLSQRKLSYLQPNKNILFFDTAAMADKFLRGYPDIKSVQADKKLFHAVEFTFTKRVAIGIWCSGGTCRYFDDQWFSWGNAPQSSGSLMLSIDDQRAGQEDIDKEFLPVFQSVTAAAQALDISVRRIVIPEGTVGEYRLLTGGYPIYLSLEADGPAQLKAFKMFIEQKTPSGFNPEYVDLRINGRIYYR